MKMNNVTGLMVAGVLVLIGMSLPWMRIGQRGFSISISGWKGTANIQDVTLPGVLVAAAAALAIVVMLGEAKGQWKWHPPRVFPLSLCIYGFIHTGFMAIAIAYTPEMNVEIGVFVTLVGLAVLLVSTWSVYSRLANDATSDSSKRDDSNLDDQPS